MLSTHNYSTSFGRQISLVRNKSTPFGSQKNLVSTPVDHVLATAANAALLKGGLSTYATKQSNTESGSASIQKTTMLRSQTNQNHSISSPTRSAWNIALVTRQARKNKSTLANGPSTSTS